MPYCQIIEMLVHQESQEPWQVLKSQGQSENLAMELVLKLRQKLKGSFG